MCTRVAKPDGCYYLSPADDINQFMGVCCFRKIPYTVVEWQIFVEAHEEFPNLFIQSETSASSHEYSESSRASKYVMLLSNFGDEHHVLSPVSEAGFRALTPDLLVHVMDLVISHL